MRNRKLLSVFLVVAAVVLAARVLPSLAQSTGAGERFFGTWHWMFNGKSFATLILARSESGYTGSLTGSEIELNDDGSLKTAAPSSDVSPLPIEKAWLDGSDLHIVVMDGSDPMEWVVTLKDDTHGGVRPISGEMANMKPIPLEKAR